MNLTPCLLFLLTGTALLAGPTKPSDLVAEALPILQSRYVDFQALHYQPGDRLNDLIARSNGKISLHPPGADTAPTPILSTSLPGSILYWRLASFTPKTSWPDFETALNESTAQGVTGLILDLRTNLAPDDYSGAARLLAILEPHDATLAKFLSDPAPSEQPLHSPIMLLVNDKTLGAAEALAASLQADGALVIGRATAGKAAVFEEQTLSSGQVLRYMAGPVELPPGVPLWGHPVSPDIGLIVHDETEKAALALIDQNAITEVIGEADERHRMSEASLVRGEDPEEDAYLATLEKNSPAGRLKLPAIHDTVLITALDSLKAIEVSLRPVLPSTQADVPAQPGPPTP
jgi:hypothetical protein